MCYGFAFVCVCGWLFATAFTPVMYKYLAYKSCLFFIIALHITQHNTNMPYLFLEHTHGSRQQRAAVCWYSHMTHRHTYLPSVAIHENRTLCGFQAVSTDYIYMHTWLVECTTLKLQQTKFNYYCFCYWIRLYVGYSKHWLGWHHVTRFDCTNLPLYL